jgi:hypothetical protein
MHNLTRRHWIFNFSVSADILKSEMKFDGLEVLYLSNPLVIPPLLLE